MLTLLAKLLHALNSDSSIRQIALAIALGFIVGLSPLFTLHNIAIIFFVLLIRVHLGSFILAVGFFSGLSYLLSPAIVSVGESLLTQPALAIFFTSLYQFDWFKLAHWHHTYVLGALVLGVALCVPIYFTSKLIIEKYRVHIMTFFQKFRIVKALKASKFYSLYSRFSGESSFTKGGL
ncbi:TIGR03546 family protein [Colwellia ponticola]|uniref:TIGR03546 family protein n=1 Tax=Colwellia ponticola TaxID=2304625 RepID=A0A8H2PL52_9GAMM|nr:TIGR03546 family protein [Colwellia ponticola]TMM47458.1 TIGR03546 family protein [Colwellia ponticola]